MRKNENNDVSRNTNKSNRANQLNPNCDNYRKNSVDNAYNSISRSSMKTAGKTNQPSCPKPKFSPPPQK